MCPRFVIPLMVIRPSTLLCKASRADILASCYLTSETLLIHFFYMPTTKKRLNITLPSYLDKALTVASKRDKEPKAKKALELLEWAFELMEDQILSEIAAKRDVKGAKYLSEKQVWKMFMK